MKRTPDSGGDDRFLKTGAPLYLDALDAIGEFEVLVQDRTIATVRKRLSTLGSGLGIRISEAQVARYNEAEKPGRNVGARLVVSGLGTFYFFVCFSPKELGESRYYAGVTLWRNRRDAGKAFWAALKRAAENEGICGNNWIHFGRVLEVKDIAAFDKRLDTLIGEMCAFLKKSRGRRSLLVS